MGLLHYRLFAFAIFDTEFWVIQSEWICKYCSLHAGPIRYALGMAMCRLSSCHSCLFLIRNFCFFRYFYYFIMHLVPASPDWGKQACWQQHFLHMMRWIHCTKHEIHLFHSSECIRALHTEVCFQKNRLFRSAFVLCVSSGAENWWNFYGKHS